MRLVSFEHIHVKDWCKPAQTNNLVNEAGNRVHFYSAPPPQPPIDVMGLRAKGDVFGELVSLESALPGFVTNFDPAARKVVHRAPPFIAKLENVRIEYPGFGVFVDEHLLLAESYHDVEGTAAVMGWYNKLSMRRTVSIRVQLETEAGWHSEKLSSNFFIDRGTDQYFDEAAILLSGTAASNYHHWMIEILPKLWCLDAMPELKSLPFLVRGPLTAFQAETLAAMGIPSERLRLFTGNLLEMKTLVFPSHIVPGNCSAQVVSWLRTKLMPALLGTPPLKPEGLVYVSRGRATRRRVQNEDQLVPQLEARGFRVCFMEDMTVKQQMAAFAGAKMVVMPHGAAGTNIVFAQPGCVFIEMVPFSYQHYMGAVYASLNNCIYGAIVCEDSGTQDMVVDVAKLLNVVDRALETATAL